MTLQSGPVNVADGKIEAYYLEAQQLFFMKTREGRFIRIREGALKRELRALGVSNEAAKGQALNDQEVFITDCMHTKDIVFAGPLAGYQQGFYEQDCARFLVTNSPKIIEPKEGEWPVIRLFMDNLLGDQSPWVWGWLKLSYECLVANERRAAPALILAGKRESGKSVLQSLITDVIGGRSTKPYQVMSGKTAFNSEMFEAEHLMLEDEIAHNDINSRREVGGYIKLLTACEQQRCHGKGLKAFMVRPFWRLSVSVNDEPESLMVLPPIDESLEDKLIILRAYKHPMPMPTETLSQRKAFMNRLKGELPAFIHFLVNWEIPEDMRSHRWGIKFFHNQEVVAMINDLAPEMKLLQLIDKEFSYNMPYVGTSMDIEHALKSSETSVGYDAKQLLKYNTACGQYLARLEKKYPNRISSRKVHTGKKEWTIRKDVFEQENEKMIDEEIGQI